jgi:hypothetical protein
VNLISIGRRGYSNTGVPEKFILPEVPLGGKKFTV